MFVGHLALPLAAKRLAPTVSLGWFALIGWIMVPWAMLADRGSTAPSAA